jgi:1,4-dihydroxy-2-naphthoyl-CoA hydrolase
MSIWKSTFTLADLQAMSNNTLVAHLGIQYTEVGEDFIRASMPVDHRTHQPMGILHGGASVVLAETLGSVAAQMAAEPGNHCVGLDINANHLSAIRTGLVFGEAKPVHIGRSTQVWAIHIADENDKAICVARLTMAVLTNR